MSFNILLLFVLLGCGVKGDPGSPKTSATPSLLENYSDIETAEPLNDQRKMRR